MVPDPSKSSLGMEYFCDEGDAFWTMTDADLVEMAKKEIDRIGLARYADVEDGVVVRVQNAYPVYDSEYRDYLAKVREFVDGLENFQTIGRNGLHRYNNQDHSMLTAMLAVRNMMLGEHNDLWNVNTDQEYHEEVREEAAEKPEIDQVFKGALQHVFSRLDPVALGLAVGITSGASLLFATAFLVIKGGPFVGNNLRLLNQFFPGYEVTLTGSLVGLVYAFVVGFVLGWAFAYMRNLGVLISALVIHRDIEFNLLRRFLDYM